VYRDGLLRAPAGLKPLSSGDVVELMGEPKEALGFGLWDADSPICTRVFERPPSAIDDRARGRARGGSPLDESSIALRIDKALRLRDDLFGGDSETTAYRLCNGEGDRVPGLVLDRYGDVAVLRLDGGHLHPWLTRLKEPLAALLDRRGVRRIGLRATAAERGGKKLSPFHGDELPDRVTVRERGVSMEVDLAHGQKTGAFLDQRENRARVRALASNKRRVLNLFSYAGGFSIAAALGGASHVTSVDSASGAHASAQRTFRANGVDPGAHTFVAADVFALLDQAKLRGDRYDLVISDPPSFAPSERAKARAVSAYRRLHAAAAAVLAEGGVLCAASCSSHISVEDFMATLDDATLGRDDLRLRAIHGQPDDHPTLPVWPEGRYLKFAILA
jgi:23S rRNA (cytosine1962-C5)-methyltransferase